MSFRYATLTLLALLVKLTESISLANDPAINIFVEIAPDHLEVEYHLPSPQKSVQIWFGAEQANWKSKTKGVSLSGDRVSSDSNQAISHFSLSVPTNPPSINRAYPTLWSMGEHGQLVFLRNLLVESDISQVISLNTNLNLYRAGEKVGSTFTDNMLAVEDYILATDQKIHNEKQWFLVANAAPDWVIDKLPETIDLHFNHLATAFGKRPDKKLAIYLDWQRRDEPISSWEGDVAGDSIFYRLFGADWLTSNQHRSEILLSFIAHEVFHVWNTGIYKATDAATEPWLHEGMARYYEHLSISNGPKETGRWVAEKWSTCAKALKGRDFSQIDKIVNGGLRYVCGAAIFGMWDIMENDGKGSLESYTSLISRFLNTQKNLSYNKSAFLKAVSKHQVLVDIIQQSTPGKWEAASRAIAATDLPFTYSPPIEGRRKIESSGFAFALLKGICGENQYSGIGYFNDYIRIFASETCDPGLVERDIIAINGNPFSADWGLIDNSVREACKNKGKVVFTPKDGGPNIEKQCHSEIPALKPELRYKGLD